MFMLEYMVLIDIMNFIKMIVRYCNVIQLYVHN